VNFGQLTPFSKDLIRFQADGFETDRAIDDLTDLAIDIGRASAGFGDMRRVGSNTINYAPGIRFLDLGHISGIDKQFHIRFFPATSPHGEANSSIIDS
jgi:hypothetical protein